MFHSSRFEPNGDGYNGLLVLLLVLGLAGWDWRHNVLFVAAAAPFVVPLSFLFHASMRFLIPVFPLYVVYTAVGLFRWTRGFSGAAGRAAGIAVLALDPSVLGGLASAVLMGVGLSLPYAVVYEEGVRVLPGSPIGGLGFTQATTNIFPITVTPLLGAAFAAGDGEAAWLAVYRDIGHAAHWEAPARVAADIAALVARS